MNSLLIAMKSIEVEDYEYIQFQKMKSVYEKTVGYKETDNDYIGFLVCKDIWKSLAPQDEWETVVNSYLENRLIYNLIHKGEQ